MRVCDYLVVNTLLSTFGEQWATELFTTDRSLSQLLHPLTIMAERSRLLRALQLQRIAETARKINPNFRPTHTTSITPTILKSLPEHKPLLPLLLSHDVPPKLARVCADKYDTHANELRSKTETKLAPYLLKLSGGQPTGIYSVFLENYSQALRDWAQSVLNAALRNLKRESVQLRNWEATYPAPLWLPVCTGIQVATPRLTSF